MQALRELGPAIATTPADAVRLLGGRTGFSVVGQGQEARLSHGSWAVAERPGGAYWRHGGVARPTCVWQPHPRQRFPPPAPHS